MQTAGEEMREKMSRCAYYLSLLLKLARLKYVARKCKYCVSHFNGAFATDPTALTVASILTVGKEQGCPRIIQSKLFRNFTVETFNNGR